MISVNISSIAPSQAVPSMGSRPSGIRNTNPTAIVYVEEVDDEGWPGKVCEGRSLPTRRGKVATTSAFEADAQVWSRSIVFGLVSTWIRGDRQVFETMDEEEIANDDDRRVQDFR